MQILAAVAAFGFLVGLFLPADDDPSGPPAANSSGEVDGAAVYAVSCAGCHGGDGQGGIAPQLGDGAVIDAFPDPADQIAVVTDGRGGMPAFGSRLSTEEIEAVVRFTRDELGT